MAEQLFILHNPGCSKSRKALELLQEKGAEPDIVDYLHGELSRALLEKVLFILGLRPKDVLRTKEEVFQSLDLDLEDDEAVVKAILENPILLERPIVYKGHKAVIGRPPENVLDLLQ